MSQSGIEMIKEVYKLTRYEFTPEELEAFKKKREELEADPKYSWVESRYSLEEGLWVQTAEKE